MWYITRECPTAAITLLASRTAHHIAIERPEVYGKPLFPNITSISWVFHAVTTIFPINVEIWNFQIYLIFRTNPSQVELSNNLISFKADRS